MIAKAWICNHRPAGLGEWRRVLGKYRLWPVSEE